MTKQETIAKAYGEHWETVKDFVDENGWIKTWDLIQIFGIVPKDGFEIKIKGKKIKHQDNLHRPKSLKGIENNRWWIKIESEEDLPKESGFYFGKDYEFGTDIMYFDFETKKWKDLSGYIQRVTHYQPIVKPEPPIY